MLFSPGAYVNLYLRGWVDRHSFPPYSPGPLLATKTYEGEK
jgi:hypothetical protein